MIRITGFSSYLSCNFLHSRCCIAHVDLEGKCTKFSSYEDSVDRTLVNGGTSVLMMSEVMEVVSGSDCVVVTLVVSSGAVVVSGSNGFAVDDEN